MSTVAKIDFPTVFEMFRRLGGSEIGNLAESYWTSPTAEEAADYIAKCMPFYNRRHETSHERLADCGHNLVVDNPDRVFRTIREFILVE